MFNKEKAKGFIAGVCATAILASVGTSIAATAGKLEMKEVYSGNVKIFWSGVERHFKDAEGNEVQPVIIDGSTYIPVRGVANLTGKSVDWDGTTKTVYIDGKVAKATTPAEEMKNKINKSNSFNVYSDGEVYYYMKDKKIACENAMPAYMEGTSSRSYVYYVLDGQYGSVVGEAVMPYTKIGSSNQGTIQFFNVENDGTETLIESIELKQTEDPVPFNVDLRGYKNLKIAFDSRVIATNVFFLGK